jgi:hypoxanthine phosphoribosyltransferase
MKETFQSAINNLKNRPAPYTVVALVLVLTFSVVPLLRAEDRLVAFVVAVLIVTGGVIYFHYKDVGQSKDTSLSAEHNRDEELVRGLRARLDGAHFPPDLIVGIARSGLIVAGYLSKQLTKEPSIPVISLWRTSRAVDYQNPFNHFSFSRKDLDPGIRRPINILIVDAFCIQGRTLELAKAFIKESIRDKDVHIKTAAVFLRLDVGDRKTPPDFYAKETTQPVYAFGEKE